MNESEGKAPEWRVRRLGPGDVGVLQALNQLYATAFDEQACYAERPPGAQYLSRQLANDDTIILVVEQAHAVVAGLTAYRLHKLEQERSEIYVYDVAVAASHRRRGMARALIQAVIDLARAGDTWAVFVQADADDEPPVQLYSSYGYEREDAAHFDLFRREGQNE